MAKRSNPQAHTVHKSNGIVRQPPRRKQDDVHRTTRAMLIVRGSQRKSLK